MNLTVATLLWEPNINSLHFSLHYNEEWVEKLYRGFARNLTVPFRFVCFTDKPRYFKETAIRQAPIERLPINYGTCIEPFKLGEPMILVGLDTVIVRNIDHLAEYCIKAGRIALPLDPYNPAQACNGVVLCPPNQEAIFTEHRGENDMEWLRTRPHNIIDYVFPGSVVSYKGHVLPHGIENGMKGVDIVYFHGNPKMHEIPGDARIQEHWV